MICAGITTITNNYGFYSLNVPIGTNIIKCAASGFTTKTITTSIFINQVNILNITLTGGTNSITIYSNSNQVCLGGTITFYSQIVGYDGPVQYQWKIYKSGYWINIGTDNSIFSYNLFEVGDIIKCEVRDDLDILNNTFTSSNQIEVYILPKVLSIYSNPPATGSIVVIAPSTLVTFTANAQCYNYPVYQWFLNTIIPVGSNTNIYYSSTLQNNDTIHCVVNGEPSNYILISVVSTTTTTTEEITTTTTTLVSTTTLAPTTTLIPLGFFEIFGQLYTLS